MKLGATFGARFRDARLAAGLSQDVLADRLGITKSAISQWELGNKSPRFELWAGIRRELGLSLDQLISGEHVQPSGALRAAEPMAHYPIGKTAPSETRIRESARIFAQLNGAQQKAVLELMRNMALTTKASNPTPRSKKARPRT
jgi:transcriptional regulator with XRE-family HTH domain